MRPRALVPDGPGERPGGGLRYPRSPDGRRLPDSGSDDGSCAGADFALRKRGKGAGRDGFPVVLDRPVHCGIAASRHRHAPWLGTEEGPHTVVPGADPSAGGLRARAVRGRRGAGGGRTGGHAQRGSRHPGLRDLTPPAVPEPRVAGRRGHDRLVRTADSAADGPVRGAASATGPTHIRKARAHGAEEPGASEVHAPVHVSCGRPATGPPLDRRRWRTGYARHDTPVTARPHSVRALSRRNHHTAAELRSMQGASCGLRAAGPGRDLAFWGARSREVLLVHAGRELDRCGSATWRPKSPRSKPTHRKRLDDHRPPGDPYKNEEQPHNAITASLGPPGLAVMHTTPHHSRPVRPQPRAAAIRHPEQARTDPRSNENPARSEDQAGFRQPILS